MSAACDVLIVGGGPAGATAAILLSECGWRVTVIEKARFPRRKVCGEFISAGTWRYFARLGIADALAKAAGPPVDRIGIFAADAVVVGRLSGAAKDGAPASSIGRALGRETLDRILLERAAECGADVMQPCRATAYSQHAGGVRFRIESKCGKTCAELNATIAIAAHGSWESGALQTMGSTPPPRPGDLFGFKARFRAHSLARGLMPLIAFPGGYGGMVESDGQTVSLSLCIRRDRLARLRRAHRGQAAALCVAEYLLQSVRGVREALASATLEDAWLSAGPIRPGFRHTYRDGVFFIGNAAGEAHPIVAEGISMAITSARLLAERLLDRECVAGARVDRAGIARSYDRSWRRACLPRIRAAALFAQIAERPSAPALLLPLFRAFPALLAFGAALSGKRA